MIPNNGKKSVVRKTSRNETVKLTVLADGRKLPMYMIQNHNTMLRDKIPPQNHCQMPTSSSNDQ
jgi:hypothetical protein